MAGKALTGDDFKKVYNALYNARTKWRPIGIQLDIKSSGLDDIEKRYFVTWGNDRCLEEMVRKWLKNRPNWEVLITALKSPQVDEEGVAYEIESLVSPENCYMTGKGAEVARVGEDVVVKVAFEKLGTPIRTIGGLKSPQVDEEGVAYEIESLVSPENWYMTGKGAEVARVGEDVVVKVAIEKLGTPIRTIGGLNQPWGVAVNERGEIIVVESYGNCVSIFSPQGEKIRSFGSDGEAPGEFSRPAGVAVDRDSNILVTDCGNDRVQKFSSDGKFIKSVCTKGNGPLQFYGPVGIAISQEDRIYVCDSNNHRVQVLNPDLTFHSSFGSEGSDNGQFNSPYGVAFDSRGDVYIADSWNHRIQVLTGDGQFLRKFGKTGSGDGELIHPTSVTIDSDDMVFVADDYNYRVSVFTSRGQFVRTFGAKGAEPGQFSSTRGIALDRNGLVYVSDDDNNRLQIF